MALKDLAKKVGDFLRPQTGTLATAGRNAWQTKVNVPTPIANTANRTNFFGQGLGRIGTALDTKPLSFTPLAWKGSVVPLVKTIAPNSQTAEDVAYGLRGALGITPFQTAGFSQLEKSTAPTTDRQKSAERVGRNVYGTILTAPLGGSNYVANIASRAVQGSLLGAGLNTAKNVITGKPLAENLGESAYKGLENSWQLAFTNLATNKLASLFPATRSLTTDSLAQGGNLLKNAVAGGSKMAPEIFKHNAMNLFKRALLETPIEDTWFTAVNKLSGVEKESFIKAWWRDLAGTAAGNIAFAGLNVAKQGVFDMNKPLIDAAKTSFMNTVKNMFKNNQRNQGGYFAGPNAQGFDNKLYKFSNLTDQKERVEISDKYSKVILPKDFKGNEFTLKQVLEHPELYKDYPQFKDITVKTANLGGANAQYDKTGTILIDENFLRHPTAYGSIKLIDTKGNPVELTFNPYTSAKDRIKSVILHEVQHAIQETEGFARGGSPKNVTSDMMRQVGQGELPYDAYRKLAGEVEARDVQSRMNLPQEQLSTTQPLVSQKVPLKDQIVDYQGGSSESKSGLTPEVKGKTIKIVSDPLQKELQAAVKSGDITPEEAMQLGMTPSYKIGTPATENQVVEGVTKIKKNSVQEKLMSDFGYTKEDLSTMSEKDMKAALEDGIPAFANEKFQKQFDAVPRETTQNTIDQLNEQPKVNKAARIVEIETNKQFAESKAGKQKFDESFARWIGGKQAAPTKGLIEAQAYKDLDPKTAESVIKEIETPGSTNSKEVKELVEKLGQSYDELYAEAQNAGVDMGYRENYLTHIWNKPTNEVKNMYANMRGKFGFSKERSLPTYEEGVKMGLEPKYSQPSQIVSEYVTGLEKTKANLAFFNDLRNNNVVLPASMADSSWKPVTAQGFPRDGRSGEIYYAPPDIADKINNVFSRPNNGFWGKLFDVGSKVSRTTQDITLSGGVPRTPLNAFGAAQVTKELTAGRVKSALTAPFANDAFFQKNLSTIQKLQEHNISLRTTYDIESLAPKSFVKSAFGDNFSEAWHKNVDDPTFKKLLPALQINLFNDIEKDALKQGMEPKQAADVAAEAVKNFYGVIGSDTAAGRTQIGKDIGSTVFFAPRYRESMINFWGKTLKSILPVGIKDGKLELNNPISLENKTNTTFAVGAVVTYLGMNALNQKLTGHPMSENPKGKEDKLLVPVSAITGNPKDTMTLGIPFLSSIATMPRTAYKVAKNLVSGDIPQASKEATSVLSTPLQNVGQVMKNEDYFGNPIYDTNDSRGQQVVDQGKYLLTNINHPWIKAGLEAGKNIAAGGDTTKKESGNIIFDSLTTKGVKPWYQIASQGVESPIRFYKNINGSYYFDEKDKILKTVDSKTANDYNSLHDGNTPVTVAGADTQGTTKQQTMTNAAIRLNNPQVYITEKQIALATSKKTGDPVDPLYTVPFETAYVYFRYQSFGGSLTSEGKQLYKEHPEIGELAQARSKFFTDNPIEGQVNNTANLAPKPSARAQALMDQGNFKDPEVKAYLDANTAWKNEQRALLGLSPLAGYGGWGDYQKKITVKKTDSDIPGLSDSASRVPTAPAIPKAPKITKIKKATLRGIKIAQRAPKKIIVKKFKNTLTNGTKLA